MRMKKLILRDSKASNPRTSGPDSVTMNFISEEFPFTETRVVNCPNTLSELPVTP